MIIVCLQIYQELLSLMTCLRVHSNSKEVSYLTWKNMYPNLKTTCHIKLNFFLWNKLIENLLLAKYLLSVTAPLISNITRYLDVWSEYFSKHNVLNFGIPGEKIQNLLGRIKNLKSPSNSTLSCIFILCGTNNVDHNSPEEIVSGLV